jgi:hypothetical protein
MSGSCRPGATAAAPLQLPDRSIGGVVSGADGCLTMEERRGAPTPMSLLGIATAADGLGCWRTHRASTPAQIEPVVNSVDQFGATGSRYIVCESVSLANDLGDSVEFYGRRRLAKQVCFGARRPRHSAFSCAIPICPPPLVLRTSKGLPLLVAVDSDAMPCVWLAGASLPVV